VGHPVRAEEVIVSWRSKKSTSSLVSRSSLCPGARPVPFFLIVFRPTLWIIFWILFFVNDLSQVQRAAGMHPCFQRSQPGSRLYSLWTYLWWCLRAKQWISLMRNHRWREMMSGVRILRALLGSQTRRHCILLLQLKTTFLTSHKNLWHLLVLEIRNHLRCYLLLLVR